MEKFFKFVLYFFISCLISCDLDIYRPLSGRYFFVSLGGTNTAITQEGRPEEVVIPCKIKGYKYNKNYIIVKREKVTDCVWSFPKRFKESENLIQYWIILVNDDIVHGPLSLEEYLVLRDNLQIPVDLFL